PPAPPPLPRPPWPAGRLAALGADRLAGDRLSRLPRRAADRLLLVGERGQRGAPEELQLRQLQGAARPVGLQGRRAATDRNPSARNRNQPDPRHPNPLLPG